MNPVFLSPPVGTPWKRQWGEGEAAGAHTPLPQLTASHQKGEGLLLSTEAPVLQELSFLPSCRTQRDTKGLS